MKKAAASLILILILMLGAAPVLALPSLDASQLSESFDEILSHRTLWGMTFHDGKYAAGAKVKILAPVIHDGVLYYRVRFASGKEDTLARYYLVSADERLRKWEKKNLPEDILAVSGDESEPALGSAADQGLSVAELFANDSGAQEFSGEYKERLLLLAQSHPTWKFVKKTMKVTFSEAVEAELENGRSWIEGSADEEYVNKNDSKGSGWYSATKAGVEHYLDPRLYLNDENIFAFETQTSNPSYQTAENVAALLSGTFMDGELPGTDMTYAQAFAKIGAMDDVNANPFFLASRVKQEQGSGGTSGLISGTYGGYEGYYNYFNIGATGTGATAIINGLKYASAKGDYGRPWNTRYKALLGGSQYAAAGYIAKGQDTLFFQKYNLVYSPYYAHQYMQNIRAPYFESKTLAASYSKAGIIEKPFVFVIPVFEELPADAPSGEEGQSSEKSVENISLYEEEISLYPGQKERLLFSYKPVAAGLSFGDLLFESGDESVAVVDEKGFITAIAAADEEVVISVSLRRNAEIRSECRVKVNELPISVYDRDEHLIDQKNASYSDSLIRVYPGDEEDFYSGPDASANGVFCGWFSQPGGAGLRLWPDYRITSPMGMYPCYKTVPASGLKIMPVGDYVFTGEAIRPPVDVYFDGTHMTAGEDYKLSYKQNRDVGTATIIINGKKSFGSVESVSFKIVQAPADYDTMSALDVKSYVKNRTVLCKPKCFYRGLKPVKGRDYELNYPMGALADAYGVPGIFPIKVTFVGDETGTLAAYEELTADKKDKSAPMTQIALKDAVVSGVREMSFKEGTSRRYLQTSLTVSLGGKLLTENKDYVLSYKNECTKGRASVMVRGIGRYKGTITKKYRIY